MRFLVVGTLNTGWGYLVYVACLLAGTGPSWAFSISWLVGIGSSYLLNLKITFRTRHSTGKMLLFPVIYGSQYVIGLIILKLSLAVGLPPFIAVLPGLLVTVPLTFLAMSLILRPAPRA